MNWITYQQLGYDVATWANKLPQIDLIIGVPRSGMLVATMLGCHLNLPVLGLDAYLAGSKYWWMNLGVRSRSQSDSGDVESVVGSLKPHRVLVVDDSASTGNSVINAHKMVKKARLAKTVQTAVVYASPDLSEGKQGKIDHIFRSLSFPRLFEWNWLHHMGMSDTCFDIDGVLTEDPAPGVDDDGPIYRDYLQKCPPQFIPSRKVKAVVSCRLEKYRDLTETWLKKHGVRYGQLFLMQYATREERIRDGQHGIFKAKVAREVGASLFVESSIRQAAQIYKGADIPVLCIETMSMLK